MEPAAPDRPAAEEVALHADERDAKASGAGQGRATPRDWLKRVTTPMRAAESLLAAADASGKASEAQRAAVSELDAMIARLQKQCEKCGGQCQKPGAPQSQPKPSGKAGNAPGKAAATAATPATAPADRSALGALVKDLWGRLPERQRQELLQPLNEEFLPEYAADIEEYFRVLAESPGEKPAEKRP